MLDIDNWPRAMPSSVMVPGGFRWKGEPWQAGSYIVSVAKLLGMTLKEEVLAPAAGELFRVESRKAGFKYITACRVADAGPEEAVVTLTTTWAGWPMIFARFTPRSQFEAGQQFSDRALQTEMELAWLRAKEGPQGAVGGTTGTHQPNP
jgi:hypothetical protein